MTVELMPFQEQIKIYPELKKLLLTPPPKLDVPAISPPWRVYVRRTMDSGWARKDFPTYKAAFDFFKEKHKIWYDVSITSKRQSFNPPGRYVRLKKNGRPVMVETPTGPRQATKLVRLVPPGGHAWCVYCRRFSVFTWFTTHHAFRGDAVAFDQTERRCSICGIREATGGFR